MSFKEIILESNNKYFKARNFLVQYAVNEKLNIYFRKKGKDKYMGNRMKIVLYPSLKKIVIKDVIKNRVNRLEKDLKEELNRRII